MINYSLDGSQSVKFHYKTRLTSNYWNHLLYNIFKKGIVPESGTLSAVDDNGDSSILSTRVKVPEGFSFFVTPNNRYSETHAIQNNFNNLTTTQQNILERQVLKCDIVKDFTVTPTPGTDAYLVAEYNYLEFTDLPVEFSFEATKPTDNRVILCKVGFSGTNYIQEVQTTEQDVSSLESTILYEMNVDAVSGYHAGNESGYIPISNDALNLGLNADMIAGYSGHEVALKWQNNSGLNVEYIADEFGSFRQPGNTTFGNIPLSNKILNVNLNAELLGGSGYTALEQTSHYHNLDNITDGVIYRRPVNVTSGHLLIGESFNYMAITKDKIASECFFARNDDAGGIPLFITGQDTLTANYSHIYYDPKKQSSYPFSQPPDIMIQIVDTGSPNFDSYHVKVKAIDITSTHFTVEYTAYTAANLAQYTETTLPSLTIQWFALGYGKKNYGTVEIPGNRLGRTI